MRVACAKLNLEEFYFPRIVEIVNKIEIYFLDSMPLLNDKKNFEEITILLFNDIKTFSIPKNIKAAKEWIRFYNVYRNAEKHITAYISKDSSFVCFHTHIPNILINDDIIKYVIEELEKEDKILFDSKKTKNKLSFISR